MLAAGQGTVNSGLEVQVTGGVVDPEGWFGNV
jgi:hypothetical protein